MKGHYALAHQILLKSVQLFLRYRHSFDFQVGDGQTPSWI